MRMVLPTGEQTHTLGSCLLRRRGSWLDIRAAEALLALAEVLHEGLQRIDRCDPGGGVAEGQAMLVDVRRQHREQIAVGRGFHLQRGRWNRVCGRDSSAEIRVESAGILWSRRKLRLTIVPT